MRDAEGRVAAAEELARQYKSERDAWAQKAGFMRAERDKAIDAAGECHQKERRACIIRVSATIVAIAFWMGLGFGLAAVVL